MENSSDHRSGMAINGRVVFRVGIALVLVGMLLLFRYTIEAFGPVARLGLGATASAGLIVAGLMVPRRVYGRLLEGAGVAGAYTTAWAAHGRYDLVDATIALVQMLLVALVGVTLAWRERSDTLSAVGMIGAVAAPLLLGGEFAFAGGEVGYQVAALVVAGALYAHLGWSATLAVTVTGSGLALAFHASSSAPLVLVGVAVWWLVGWALPKVGYRLGIAKEPTEITAVATLPVSPVAWAMVWMVDGRPAVITAVAAVAAVAHGYIWWLDRETRAESVVDLLVAVGFSGIALVSWFDPGHAVSLYLLVSAGIAVYGSRVGDRVSLVVGSAATVPAIMFWLLVVGEEGGGFEWDAALADLAAVLIVAGAAYLLDGAVQRPAGIAAYLMALVWVGRYPGEIDPGWATAGLAVIGLTALVTGRIRRSGALGLVGLGTVALAVAKLILVDLASADPILKIALSFGIGLCLLVVGYWIGDNDVVSTPDGESAEEVGSGAQ